MESSKSSAKDVSLLWRLKKSISILSTSLKTDLGFSHFSFIRFKSVLRFSAHYPVKSAIYISVVSFTVFHHHKIAFLYVSACRFKATKENGRRKLMWTCGNVRGQKNQGSARIVLVNIRETVRSLALVRRSLSVQVTSASRVFTQKHWDWTFVTTD